jgi:phospholipid/cholesterol/gamma-HCH transport system substrate-binding protein
MKRGNEVSVGILITVAVIVLVAGTLYLVRGGLSAGYPLYTRFPWGQNLKQGQPVLLAGVTVGYVGDVQLRRAGYLDVVINVNDEYHVPKGSTATVKPVGIFGDVAVALTPPNPAPPQDYAPGDTVPSGTPPASIDEIMGHVDSISITTQALLTSLKKEIIDAGTLRDAHRAITSAAQLSAQLQTVIAEQNRNATATLRSFSDAATHLSNAVDSAQVQATLVAMRRTTENASRLVANIDSTNAQLRGLLTLAQSGNGTVGKLLTDSLLYSDIRHTVASMDSLLADIKANPKKYINLRIF